MKCDECKHRQSCEYTPNCESYEIDIEVHDEIIRGDIIAELEEEKIISGIDLNYLDYIDGINKAIEIVRGE